MRYLFLLLFLVSCAPKKSEDCGFVQNVYGQRIQWSSLPVTLNVDKSVSDEYMQSIVNAATTLETAIGTKAFLFNRESGSLPGRDKKSGIYFLTSWDPARKSEQGRTSIYWAGNEIQEADIRINMVDFKYYTRFSSASEKYNLEALLLHEMGHLIGLKHQKRNTSVMEPELSAYTDRVELSSLDKQNIECGYGSSK